MEPFPGIQIVVSVKIEIAAVEYWFPPPIPTTFPTPPKKKN